MKPFLLICAVVAGQSVLAADKKPLTKEEESAKEIEKAIRKELKKPTGELTKADLEKVTLLYLRTQQLTSVKGLEKLNQLTIGSYKVSTLKKSFTPEEQAFAKQLVEAMEGGE